MAFLDLHPLRRPRLAPVLLLIGALSACGDQASDASALPPAEESLCPSCKVLAGGETSDFGASVGVCGAVLESVSLTQSEADALGYDIAGAKKLIEREVDMPMTWRAQDTMSGEPATGYDEHETRIHAKLSLTNAYTHSRRSAKYCDGTKCTYEGETQVCTTELLFLHFEVEFATLDGAVKASATGETALWNEPGAGHELSGDAYADLRAATGSLRMHPNVPEPRIGVLMISFLFMPDATQGSIWPKVLPDIADATRSDAGDEGASDFFVAGYEPLEGVWPCHEQAMASDSVYCAGATAQTGGPPSP